LNTPYDGQYSYQPNNQATLLTPSYRSTDNGYAQNLEGEIVFIEIDSNRKNFVMLFFSQMNYEGMCEI
jgi:hypothetical protein